MRFDELIKKVHNLPVIDTESLLVGGADAKSIQVQISRWRRSGKLIKLKNNLYLLSKDIRKIEAHEFYIASLLTKPSYVSLEKALEYYGLIPEAVSVYTCVTTKRPKKITTPIGVFDYRHVKNDLFWGYRSVTFGKQLSFMAYPEKALLDFFYLRGLSINIDYLEEMRLQNLEELDLSRLVSFAKKFHSPGVIRVASLIEKYALEYTRVGKDA